MKIPKKSLSQNFIKDKNICKKILRQTSIKNRIVLEIGPGYGFLTDFILLNNPQKLILIEKDNKIFKFLKNKYLNNKKIILIHEDILNYNFTGLEKLIIISNLPYNISSKIILRLFKNYNNISEMILMIQKEMALKFDYSLKKLNKYKFFCKIFSNYKRCFDVSPNVFFPRPKIQSTVVKFKIKNTNIINFDKVLEFSKKVFKNKRKKISNNLKLINFYEKDLLNKRIDEINIKEILRIYNFI